MSSKPRAFVLGGGVAGLTAAFGLADRGYQVTLCEARQHCGGRAFSFADAASGQRLDNGPHALLGCYRAMGALLQRLGTADRCQRDATLRLAYRYPGGHCDRLQLGGWPVPLAMPPALLRLGLPFRAKLRALFGMATALLPTPAHWTLADWLQRRGQTGLPDDVLWRPLCRAIMNCEPDACAARDFLATLREAFAGRAAQAAFVLPTAPWGVLLGDAAPAALARAGVALRLGARATGLVVGERFVSAVEFGDGTRCTLAADDLLVTALPWFALHRLCPALWPGAGALRSAPIVTAHFEVAAGAAVLPDEGPVVALVGGAPFHFVLRRPGGDPRRFALLSGGDRWFDGRSVAEIESAARAEMGRYYPEWSAEVATRVRITKEQHATFVAAPGSRALRPRPGRLVGGPANLRVCGDWTDTGLPATLEGAARSAEALLAGLPRR